MKRTLGLLAAAAVALLAPGAAAEEVAGLPLHVKRLDPKTVRVWVGDHISSTATVALATAKGIVVVDTLGFPKVDAELRKVIARELGRSDFAVLVNTHEHGDHTGGNSVYADCRIVGHELVGPAMAQAVQDRKRMLEHHDRWAAEEEKEMAKLAPGSPEARKARERQLIRRLNREVLVSDAKPVPPTETFADRKTLDMGDTTFDLSFIGGMHSSSDIAVFVPERGLLLTGDTMADTWLNDTPGCLAAFAARPGVPHDFPRWLANWDRLLAQKDRIKLLVPGHWNGELSLPGAAARVEYVRTLWQGMQKAAQAGGQGLEDVLSAYALEKRFPALAKSPGFSDRNHAMTVAELWRVVTGQESGALKLYALLAEGAPAAAVREVVAEQKKKPGKFFFVEPEVNAQGYRFLGEGKTAKAVAMFELYVELFPGAWNAYDSLGEALAKAGDKERSIRMYEKSVSLKPDSASGKEALARLRGEKGATASR